VHSLFVGNTTVKVASHNDGRQIWNDGHMYISGLYDGHDSLFLVFASCRLFPRRVRLPHGNSYFFTCCIRTSGDSSAGGRYRRTANRNTGKSCPFSHC
jgi:hypothetical protein